MLSDVCDTVLDPRDPKSREKDYQDRLAALKESISNLPFLSLEDNLPNETNAHVQTTLKLYQLSTLIYLVRASQNPWEAVPDLQLLVDWAFAVPIQAPACAHFFPLFVLACEARTDAQRTAVLGLLKRTEKLIYGRRMHISSLVQSVWVQQDLYADSEVMLNYAAVLNVAINTNSALPTFA